MPPETCYAFDLFSLDPNEGVLRRQGVIVALTPKAFELLLAFVRKPGHIIGAQELMNLVWPDAFVEEGNVKVTVHMLRKALGNDSEGSPYIETIPRRGYRFTAPVRQVPGGDVQVRQPILPAPPAAPEGTALETWRRRVISRRAAWYVVILALWGLAIFFARSHRPKVKQKSMQASTPATPVIRSLVVLPLQDLSGDSRQDYFAEGMTDELITDLAQVRGIRVISETSAMRYRGTREPLRQIARELDVDAVVEGAVARSRSEVRITAQLIDARTDMHLWAASYTRREHDVLSLQNEVARDITRAIRVQLTPREVRQLASAKPIDPQAYDAYLEGRYFLNERTHESLRLALKSFQLATRRDPHYAVAWAGMSDAYDLLGLYSEPAAKVMPKAKAAAEESLRLDSSLAEAHNALAAEKALYEWDWKGAEREFRRALDLNPGYAPAHHWRAVLYLAPRGRYDEAIAELKSALAIDPVSLIVNTDLGWTYFIAGRYHAALNQYRKTLALDPGFIPAHFRLFQYYRDRHMYAQALNEMRKDEGGSPAITPSAGRGNASAAHQYFSALRKLARLREGGGPPGPCYGAGYEAQLGHRRRALADLESGYKEHCPVLIYAGVDPEFSSLRSDPNFQALLRRIGLSRGVSVALRVSGGPRR